LTKFTPGSFGRWLAVARIRSAGSSSVVSGRNAKICGANLQPHLDRRRVGRLQVREKLEDEIRHAPGHGDNASHDAETDLFLGDVDKSLLVARGRCSQEAKPIPLAGCNGWNWQVGQSRSAVGPTRDVGPLKRVGLDQVSRPVEM